jgi:hypothetical protein
MKHFNCTALLDFFNTAGALPSIKQERRYNLIVIITNPVTKPIEKKEHENMKINNAERPAAITGKRRTKASSDSRQPSTSEIGSAANKITDPRI